MECHRALDSAGAGTLAKHQGCSKKGIRVSKNAPLKLLQLPCIAVVSSCFINSGIESWQQVGAHKGTSAAHTHSYLRTETQPPLTITHTHTHTHTHTPHTHTHTRACARTCPKRRAVPSLFKDRNQTALSLPAVASMDPSGLKATQCMGPRCRRRRHSTCICVYVCVRVCVCVCVLVYMPSARVSGCRPSL